MLRLGASHLGHVWSFLPITGMGITSPSQVEGPKRQHTVACPGSTLPQSCGVCGVTSQTILSLKFFPSHSRSGLLSATPS